MSLDDVERIRRLVTAAVSAHQDHGVEQDKLGPIRVTTVSRPKFKELERLASKSPSALIAVFPSIESTLERLAVCEALSEVVDAATVSFWKNIIEHESNEELLSCAAIALARQRQIALLEKLEAKEATATSLRLLFHFGVARLQLNDPRGVDYLIEVLRRDPGDEPSSPVAMLTHGPTIRFVVVGLLKRILRKGPGDDIRAWIEWWQKRRHQYQWIDGSVVPASDLAYMPPLWAFTDAQGSEHS